MSIKKNDRFRLGMLHPKFFFTWMGVFFLLLFAFIPARFKDYFAQIVAYFLVLFVRKPFKIVEANLAQCFPEMTSKELKCLSKQCAERFIITLLAQGEFLFRSWHHINKRVQFIGFDEYVQPALDKHQKILFLMPHFWGIDYAGVRLSKQVPIHVMMKEHRNPIFSWLSYRLRTRNNATMFTREQGLSKLFSGWKQGKHVAYSPDEDHGKEVSETVPFFTSEKASLPILSRINIMYKTITIPCAIGYNKSKRCFEFQFSSPIEFDSKLSKIDDARLLNKIVEDAIKQYTPDYSWVLKIFRSQKIYN